MAGWVEVGSRRLVAFEKQIYRWFKKRSNVTRENSRYAEKLIRYPSKKERTSGGEEESVKGGRGEREKSRYEKVVAKKKRD